MKKKITKPVSQNGYFTLYSIETEDPETNAGEHFSNVATTFGLKTTWYQKNYEVRKPGFFTGKGKNVNHCTLYVEGSRVDLARFERFMMKVSKHISVSYTYYVFDRGDNTLYHYTGI